MKMTVTQIKNSIKESIARQAVRILKQYNKETGNGVRGTSDLSPLETWLILKLIEKDKK